MAKKQDMNLWIKAWEDRASKLDMSSKSHALNDELRRQVLMESLPKDAKGMVEIEKEQRPTRQSCRTQTMVDQYWD